MAEPITLAQAKAHLRVTDTSEDDYITALIPAARGWVENYTGHVLVQREIVEQRDNFGRFIELHRRPLLADPAPEITYIDTDGTEQTYADGEFQLSRFPARIFPAVDGSWPSLWRYGGVTITYTAGYTAGQEPQELIQAMYLLIGHWFATRVAVNVGNIVSEVPLAVESLCGQFRAPGL